MTKQKNILWIVLTITAVYIVTMVVGVEGDLFKRTVIWLLVWILSTLLYMLAVLDNRTRK